MEQLVDRRCCRYQKRRYSRKQGLLCNDVDSIENFRLSEFFPGMIRSIVKIKIGQDKQPKG